MRPRIDVALPSDVGAVEALVLAQFAEHAIDVDRPSLVAAIEAVLRDDSLGFFLLARSGDVAVGLAYVSFTWALEHGGRSAWLEELYVVPDRREEGVGRALLDRAIAGAREHGCAAVDLEVDRDHARAERLYEREGFRNLPRRRWVRLLAGAESGSAGA